MYEDYIDSNTRQGREDVVSFLFLHIRHVYFGFFPLSSNSVSYLFNYEFNIGRREYLKI